MHKMKYSTTLEDGVHRHVWGKDNMHLCGWIFNLPRSRALSYIISSHSLTVLLDSLNFLTRVIRSQVISE